MKPSYFLLAILLAVVGFSIFVGSGLDVDGAKDYLDLALRETSDDHSKASAYCINKYTEERLIQLVDKHGDATVVKLISSDALYSFQIRFEDEFECLAIIIKTEEADFALSGFGYRED